MQKKPQRISARISSELKARIARVEAATGLSEAQQIEACVSALVEYFETHGAVTLPLAVVPKGKAPVIPAPTFPSTASRIPTGTPSLNEEPPKRDAVPPTRANTPAQPDITKTRRGIRGMIETEKGTK